MSIMSDLYIDEMYRRFDSWSPCPNQDEPCKICGLPYYMHNGPICPNLTEEQLQEYYEANTIKRKDK